MPPAQSGDALLSRLSWRSSALAAPPEEHTRTSPPTSRARAQLTDAILTVVIATRVHKIGRERVSAWVDAHLRRGKREKASAERQTY